MNQDLERYSASIRADCDRLSATARTGSLDAAVSACPGWDLRKLIVHTGTVQRWATSALAHGVAPDGGPAADPGDDELATWIVSGAAALIDAIGDDPAADTWHPFPFEQKTWVWARRMAIETMVHRWDAETAAAGSSSMDPELASIGLHEYFELGLPRVLGREHVAAPSVSLHAHCTDVDGEWLVWADNGEYKMLPIHDKEDAAIRGTAESLLLVLMGRADRDTIEIVGDASAADAWLNLPGW